MHVLQAALCVVRDGDAEIVLIFPVPECRNLIDRDLSVHERLFQFIADHDVQAVGQLVRIAAVEAWRGGIDSLIKLPFGNVGKRTAAQFLQFRIDKMDECFTAADQIFVEAGNALVHAVRHGVCGVFAVKFLRLVLHEQRVAALMERGEDIGDEIVLIIMRRDAHVPGAEVRGERMLGRHEDERVLL